MSEHNTDQPTEIVRMTGPGDLVTAIPVLMGFHPVESMVLIMMREKRVALTVRVDFPADDPRVLPGWCADTLNQVMNLGETFDGICVVQLSASYYAPAVDVFKFAAAEIDLEVHTSLWAESTQPGALWSCLCGCDAGTAGDVRQTQAAAAAALKGVVIHEGRDAWSAAGGWNGREWTTRA